MITLIKHHNLKNKYSLLDRFKITIKKKKTKRLKNHRDKKQKKIIQKIDFFDERIIQCIHIILCV